MPKDKTPGGKKKGGSSLEVNEDFPFQQRTWIYERIGWCAIAVIVLAALAGVFSTGPLSSATAGDANAGVRIEYSRFERNGAPSVLRILPIGQAGSEKQLRFRIGHNFLDNFQIEHIQPQPEESSTTADGLILAFRTADSPSGAIVLSIKPKDRRSRAAKSALSAARPSASPSLSILKTAEH